MSRKTFLALTALVALGTVALAPTSASAFGHSVGRTSMGHTSMGHAPTYKPIGHGTTVNGINHGTKYKMPHKIVGIVPPHPPKPPHPPHPPHPCHHHHCGPHYGWWWWKHHHPYWVEPAAGETEESVATSPASVAPATKSNCNCLTKTYLEDGSVMFKDLCTKEAAVATPDELKAQAAGATRTETK